MALITRHSFQEKNKGQYNQLQKISYGHLLGIFTINRIMEFFKPHSKLAHKKFDKWSPELDGRSTEM